MKQIDKNTGWPKVNSVIAYRVSLYTVLSVEDDGCLCKGPYGEEQVIDWEDISYYNQERLRWAEEELNDWGTYAALDETEKAYRLCGIATTWSDYSTGSDDPDNAWDQDKYYDDFEKWWFALPFEKKMELYNKITDIVL